MKGKVGSATMFGNVLPHANKISGIVKLTKEGQKRIKWIDYHLEGKSVVEACRHFDINRSLFYKWHDRFRRYGLAGLEDKTRRPKHVRHREVLPEARKKIEEIRLENKAWSKYKVSCILRRDYGLVASPSTVNRIFHDKNLFWISPISRSQKGAKRSWKIRRIRAPKKLRGACPGSLVEIDVKVLNSFGHVFYQFTAIDTCTKIKFIQIYSRKSAHCGQSFIEDMITFYPFRIRHVNSDNGGEFLAECHAFLESRKITHFFSRARTPKDNPMVENTIKADEYEFWAWGNLGFTVAELNKSAAYWMNKFNTYRPHQALNYLTPVAYYENNFKN
jgi:transposase